ncbi:inter-alpha-trypsin inhibitor heavy chain H4-like isoform X2 [Periplaneta americana]|uniref:inter-alpha-trypsin inhibitor heavy chain H4-like isoform X2 n=1 Tax=Periplaneta americana TaxID=6978 RepID=UPI0037E85A3A
MLSVMFVVALVSSVAGAHSIRKIPAYLLPQIYTLHVKSDIQHRYAHTLVTSKIANPANFPQELMFTVQLPDSAFISGFIIEDDGRVYKAHVEEKEAAKQEYSRARGEGRTAAHVAASARDSKRFTVSVNVEPKKKVTFNLTYEELLSRKLGTYKHVINLDPGQIVRDLSVEVHINESADITTLNVPALRTSNEIQTDTSAEGCCGPVATVRYISIRSAVVKWAPTPSQQYDLSSNGISGQFVVEYDVDRSSQPDQILVNDGYYVHFFSPADLPTLRKHVVFVLDVSGSMLGRKIQQLKEAMNIILKDLSPTDFFSLEIFSSRIQVWCGPPSNSWQSKIDGLNCDTQSAVIAATEKNVDSARIAVTYLAARGGTNIHKAMKMAIQLSCLSKRNWKTAELKQHPEPLIIFLTDGEATQGKTEPGIIMSATTRWNKKVKASIFALALGDDADMNFLRKISLRNYGFARKIYEASDANLQLRDFYRQVASPLLANVTFQYQETQVEAISVTNKRFPTFYSGTELVVAGRLQKTIPGKEFHYEVYARSPDGMVQFRPMKPPAVIDDQATNNNSVNCMERVWAYLTIKQLLDRAHTKLKKRKVVKKQALRLALKYSFVTPVTSLVVVKPNGIKALPDTEESKFPGVPTSFLHDLLFEDGPSQQEMDDMPKLVDLDQIDWLGAFTCDSKILLPFGINKTVEVLSRRTSEQHQLQPGRSCLTPDGDYGLCRHLSLCTLNIFTHNFTVYHQYFCVIESRFAGVCCPLRVKPLHP